jgi:hypothetical protein
MEQITIIRPTPKQIEAKNISLQDGVDVVLYGGAIRGGKSYWLILMFHSFCMQYPKSRWVLVRKSQRTMERTLIPTFMKVYDQGLEPYIKSVNNNAVVYHNGSEILFMSESFNSDKEMNRFKGLEINGAGIDEVNEIQECVFDKIVERSGSNIINPMPPSKVLATCNPSFSWVKKRFYDPYTTGTLRPTYAYIPAKITDNPHVPKSYLRSLKENLSTVQYERFVNGDWDIKEEVENAFANQFSYDKHVSNDVVLKDNAQLYISMDFNINPFACIIGQMYRENNQDHVVIVEELTIQKGSIQLLCDELKTRYHRYLPTCIITGDAMGSRGDIGQRENATLYEQIRRLLRLQSSQIKVPANPTHENSRADVNYFLYHQKNFKISIKCDNLVRDLMYVEADEHGKIKKANRREDTQRADHLDAFRYFVNTFCKQWILAHQKQIGITNYFNK